MHDKLDKQVLKIRQHDNVYVVDKIAKDLNEFALIVVIKNKINTTFLTRFDYFND